MSYDPGALDSTLAEAVGDDPALMAELRRAFMEGVQRHFAALDAADTPEGWQNAAWRLKGLAASFGAIDLMLHADRAAEGPPFARDAVKRLQRAIAGFDEDAQA